MTDLRSAFSTFRDDPKWVGKLALALLVDLIPYVGPVALLGWQLEFERNVARGDEGRLPSWRDFWKHALRGIVAYVIMLPYSLVLSLVITPLIIVATSVIMVGLAGFSGTPEAAAAIGVIGGAGSMFLVMPLSLLVLPPSETALARYVVSDRLEDGFAFREIWRGMKEHRPMLMRTWGWTSLLLMAVMTLVSVAMTVPSMPLVIELLGGNEPSWWTLVVALVGSPVAFLLVLPPALWNGLAVRHLWGRYAAELLGMAGEATREA